MAKKVITYTGIGIVLVVALVFLAIPKAASYSALENFDGDIIINKGISCGCCETYSKYFQERIDREVKSVIPEDIKSIKDGYDIPEEIRSCHTISIGDYYVEGHVPLEAIEKLLQEKPDIAGLAMSGMGGMPQGSPGMPGTKSGEWIIYSVNYDGTYQEFMKI